MKKAIIAAAMLICFVGLLALNIVLAAYTVTLPGTVTITPASTDVSVWTDNSCTTSLTSVAFGECRQGSASAVRNLYVRNDGDVTATVTLLTAGLPGNLSLLGTKQLDLTVGEVKPFPVWLEATPATACGAVSFSITVNSEAR